MSKLQIAEDRSALMDSLSDALSEGERCFLLICCSPEDMAAQLQRIPGRSPSPETEAARLLRRFRIPAHLEGYQQLCMAIPLFAADKSISFSKELYPQIARQLGCSDGRAVERAIRRAIRYAWEHRDPVLWDAHFPGLRQPSNKCFISTLAELLK